jgi:hypothetical protein
VKQFSASVFVIRSRPERPSRKRWTTRSQRPHQDERTLAQLSTPGVNPALLRLIEGDQQMYSAKIDIAEATVKVHVKAILRKIRSRTGRRRFGG